MPHRHDTGDLIDPAHQLSAEQIAVTVQIIGAHQISLFRLGIHYPLAWSLCFFHYNILLSNTLSRYSKESHMNMNFDSLPAYMR